MLFYVRSQNEAHNDVNDTAKTTLWTYGTCKLNDIYNTFYFFEFMNQLIGGYGLHETCCLQKLLMLSDAIYIPLKTTNIELRKQRWTGSKVAHFRRLKCNPTWLLTGIRLEFATLLE